MQTREAKYCLDRNNVRWVLLEGVINRKAPQDDPAGGQNLPVAQITSIEKTTIQRVRRSPLAKPALYAGVVLLVVFVWIASMSWLIAAPGLVLGALLFFWGLSRMSGEKEVMDAFQIVAPVQNPSDWLVVGTHSEVAGFVEGVRNEMRLPPQARKVN
jgi:hypothetical protein